jgi:hypothetical protein
MAWRGCGCRTTMPAAPSCLPANLPAAIITETDNNVSEGQHRKSHSDLAPRTKTGEQSRQQQQRNLYQSINHAVVRTGPTSQVPSSYAISKRMNTGRERERERETALVNQPRTKNRAKNRIETATDSPASNQTAAPKRNKMRRY